MKVKVIPNLQPLRALAIFCFFSSVLLLSVPHLEKAGAPNFSSFFLAYFFLFSLKIHARKIQKSLLLIFASAWMLGATFYSFGTGALPASNLLIQPNAVLLAIPLLLVPNKKLSLHVQRLLPMLVRLILLVGAAKYGASHIFAVNDRPFLFHENNFELPFFIILFLLVHKDIKFHLDFALLCFICVTSGSLSGTASLLVVIFFRRSLIKYFPHAVCVILLVAATPYGQNFVARVTAIASEERVSWLLQLAETRKQENRKIVEMVAVPQALPSQYCQLNPGWNKSELGPNICFTEALHGNVFRLIIDYGLLIALAFMVGFWQMICDVFGLRRGTLFFLLVCMNGLSVSGFANEILIAALALGYSFTGGGHRSVTMSNKNRNYEA